MPEREDYNRALYDGYGAVPEFDDELGAGGEETAPEPVFATVEAFVSDYLLALYRRRVSGHRAWCAQWWRHPEAWVRLDALWRSWEYLRLDPATGMSLWLRDHADPHMGVLLSADGPLRDCRPDRHSERPVQPLPSSPIPDDVSDPTRVARVD